jgi:hypothetical protein
MISLSTQKPQHLSRGFFFPFAIYNPLPLERLYLPKKLTLVASPPMPTTRFCGDLKTLGVGPHGRVDIACPLHYTIFYVSAPVWLMPPMAEAATAKEVVDEETTC